ncbi:MAG: gamma-glutamylcyclotransferase [Paracoccaceae bacterium]
MSKQYIYGYGSLVNRGTHDYEAHPARLQGWRRVWRHTTARPVAFLSAERHAGTTIDGLIMAAPHADPKLNERERAYDRHDVTEHVDHDLNQPMTIQVYAVSETRHPSTDTVHPIWLSYIDVVVQGYHQIYGPSGVQHFFETTDGWNAPVINDRADPNYPRHQQLTATETRLTDAWLAHLSTMPEKL